MRMQKIVVSNPTNREITKQFERILQCRLNLIFIASFLSSDRKTRRNPPNQMAHLSRELLLRASTYVNHYSDRIYCLLVKEDIPLGFRSHVFIMRVTGIWPTTNDPQWYKWLTGGFLSSLAILYPLSLFVNTFYAASIHDAMDHLFTSLTFWTVGFKAGIIYWRCVEIRAIFRIHDKLLTDDIDRTAHMNTRMHLIFTLLYCSGWCCFLVQVICSKAEEAIWPSTTRWPFEFAAIRWVYLTVVVYQAVYNLLGAIWAAMQDTFYMAIMNTACSHVIELKRQLAQLGMECGDGEDRDWRFYKDVVECCKRYEELLR